METPECGRWPAISANTPGTSSTSNRKYQKAAPTRRVQPEQVISACGGPAEHRTGCRAQSRPYRPSRPTLWAPRRRRGLRRKTARPGRHPPQPPLAAPSTLASGDRAIAPWPDGRSDRSRTSARRATPSNLMRKPNSEAKWISAGVICGDALHRHGGQIGRDAESQAGKQRQFVRRVAAAHIQCRIGFRHNPRRCASFRTSAKRSARGFHLA